MPHQFSNIFSYIIGTVNAKAMSVLGDTILAAEKAQKVLGSTENDEHARALALKDKDPDVDYNRKRIFSAPEAGSVNAKAIKVMGEKMLAAHKAQKILGVRKLFITSSPFCFIISHVI